MTTFKTEPDGTIVNNDGKILMFSIERFKNDIVLGEKCFICGGSPDDKAFNDEHILPDWILRKFGLHDRKITLPNFTGFKYGEYKIPCCAECNTAMGKCYEEPISGAVSTGYDAFAELIKKNGVDYLFSWLSLIFIKTHLKDASLRVEMDRRKGDERTIGEKFYDFETLHHTHCIARTFFTGANWGKYVCGSLFIGPAKVMDGIESFDFLDNYPTRTILLRMDEIFVIAVMNDGGQVMAHMGPNWLTKITEGLTILQLRELFARFCHCALSLESGLTFHSGFDVDDKYEITAKAPDKIQFRKFNGPEFGELMWAYCSHTLNNCGGVSQEQEKLIRSGVVSYILDENSRFKTDSIVVMPKR